MGTKWRQGNDLIFYIDVSQESYQCYVKDEEYKRLIKMSSGDEVKTINMSKQSTKQINPLKILIDNESEVRATDFRGTSKNGRTYISPQVIFVRANTTEKYLEISFQFLQLQTTIDALSIKIF